MYVYTHTYMHLYMFINQVAIIIHVKIPVAPNYVIPYLNFSIPPLFFF